MDCHGLRAQRFVRHAATLLTWASAGDRYGPAMARTRVAVIFGGRSSEHEISCVSAGSIIRALDSAGFEVVPVGIAKDGRWVLTSSAPELFLVRDGVLPQVAASGPVVMAAADPTVDFIGGVDVAFPVLHGPWGEDGTIQGLLEMAGVPYVGSGVMSSAVTMDKAAMKAMFKAAGLPVGAFEVITDAQWRADEAACLDRIERLAPTVFVKPARAGSSMGISKVALADGRERLAEAVLEARVHDPKLVVEAAVDDAREIECGVITDGAGRPLASRCAEIIVTGDHEFYDYEAKYLDDSADLVVPANLDPETERRVQQLAVEAFEALTCEGLARADFFVTREGVVINEVNTMPGFTPVSMFPRMWAASGMDYPALVEHLVHDAVRRGTGLR